MLLIEQDFECVFYDRMRPTPFDVSDKTHATSVVLVAWIVKTLFCWRIYQQYLGRTGHTSTRGRHRIPNQNPKILKTHETTRMRCNNRTDDSICELSSNNIYANLVMTTKDSKSANGFAKSYVLLVLRRG